VDRRGTLEEERLYVKGALGAQVMGFSSRDGRGQEGVVLAYDRALRGVDGHRTVGASARGRLRTLTGSHTEAPTGDVSYVPGEPIFSVTPFSADAASGTTSAPGADTGTQGPIAPTTGGTTGSPAGGTTGGLTTGGPGTSQPSIDAGPSTGSPDASVTGTDAGGRPSEMEAGTGEPEPIPSGPAEGTLHVEFTSVSLGGRYSPKNVGAVWLEDASGSYITTLERWAGIRARYLSDWNAASGGWGFFGSPEPDAVSQATLTRHESHAVTWDSRDLDGQVLPDGSYTLHIELTDADRAGATASIPFEKNTQGFSETPADQMPYTGLSLRYEP